MKSFNPFSMGSSQSNGNGFNMKNLDPNELLAKMQSSGQFSQEQINQATKQAEEIMKTTQGNLKNIKGIGNFLKHFM